MKECIGCGAHICGPENMHQSGVWCPTGGDCAITDLLGAERLRQHVRDRERAACQHVWDVYNDYGYPLRVCRKCNLSESAK